MQELNRINADYSLKDLLDTYKRDLLLSLNCHAVGIVQAFDPAKQSAQVTVAYKKTFMRADPLTGKYTPVAKDYPPLIDVPVIFPGGLTFPVKKGDSCTLLFIDRDMDNWVYAGQSTPPETPRLHSFTDAVALMGLRPFSGALSDFDNDRVALTWEGGKVGVGGNKVLIENTANTLNDLLQELIDEIKDLALQCSLLTVTGVATGGSVSGVPANAAVITAIRTQIIATATKIEGLLE